MSVDLVSRFGLRAGAGRGGIAFHIGGGRYVTAAHCVGSLSPGDVVRGFGTDLRLERILSGDVALLTTTARADGMEAYTIDDAATITPGAVLSFACHRSVWTTGTLRITSCSRRRLIGISLGRVRPLPGDSGAPLCFPAFGHRVVGLIRGAVGPGVLQTQIVIERLHGADRRGAVSMITTGRRALCGHAPR
jgi:hypothetical protein